MACESLLLLCRSLSRLEVGDVSVTSFGQQIALVHPFGSPFTDESAGTVLRRFSFDQDGTDVDGMLSTCALCE